MKFQPYILIVNFLVFGFLAYTGRSTHMNNASGDLLAGPQNPDDTFITNSLGMRLVKINPGEYKMGNESEINYTGLLNDELHTPYLAKGAPNPYIKNGPVMEENPLEWDEKPVHKVKLTKAFYMSSTPVTNAQYEQFKPEHKSLRGKLGYSKHD